MAHTCFVLSLVAILVMSQCANAKRGCSAFGHSCFGGHGKRSGDAASIETNELMGRRQSGQEETPPHPVYPHPGFGLPSGDDIIPVRDGGAYDHEDIAAREVMKFRLRNLVKRWMDTYRRSQGSDDGYFLETL